MRWQMIYINARTSLPFFLKTITKKAVRHLPNSLADYLYKLFCVAYRTSLADNGDLHLTGVSHLVLNLLCYVV